MCNSVYLIVKLCNHIDNANKHMYGTKNLRGAFRRTSVISLFLFTLKLCMGVTYPVSHLAIPFLSNLCLAIHEIVRNSQRKGREWTHIKTLRKRLSIGFAHVATTSGNKNSFWGIEITQDILSLQYMPNYIE